MPSARASASVLARGGDGDDIAQIAGSQTLGDAAGGEDGGAAGAEADDRARCDQVRGEFAGLLFERLDVQGEVLRADYRRLARIFQPGRSQLAIWFTGKNEQVKLTVCRGALLKRPR